MDIYSHNNLFVNNKYLSWYYHIIEKAISQHRKRSVIVYFENHHILPVSIFPEYSKGKWNTVLLTPREHFICHWLLTKFTENQYKLKMFKALHKMTRSRGQRNLSSRHYNIARKYNSEYMKINNPSLREDVKQKMSASAKKRKASVDTKKKLSENNSRYWLGKESPIRNTRFYNNGITQKMFREEDVPPGWVRGRLNKPWNKK